MSRTKINNSNIQQFVTYYIEDKSKLPEELTDIPIGDWEVSNVTNMEKLFYKYSSFDKPLNDWDVSNVTNMLGMFYGCESFNQPLDNWDVSYVTNMAGMFKGCISFNEPLNEWDVSNVTNMAGMFHGCRSFNQPLDKWKILNVTTMHAMFNGCTSFNQSLSSWHIQDDIDIEKMFQNSGISTENLPSFRKKELLSKSHGEILIKQHSKLIMARNKIDETITREINGWLDSGSSSTLHTFMAQAYAEKEYFKEVTVTDKVAKAMQYKAELDSGDKRLYGAGYRLLSLVTELLPEPTADTREGRIAQLSKLKFSVVINMRSIFHYAQFKNSINIIPDKVKYALKLKILLDFLFTEQDLSKNRYVILCDLFLQRGNKGILHNDSDNYPPKYSLVSNSENVEYVSLLTLNDSKKVMKGTQLVVNDTNLRKIPDKILVGLPVKLGSNIIFYDPAFLHCTPEIELIDEVQQQKTQKISNIIPFSFRKAKSMHLTQKEKNNIMGSLVFNNRRFIRCHYTPLAGTNISKYEKITDGPKVEFEDFMVSDKLTETEIESELIRCLDTILQGDSLHLDVSNATELNDVLKDFEKRDMTIGGKSKTHKQKSSHQRSNSLITTKKDKSIYKSRNSLLTKKIVKSNQNIKNGVIYCDNNNICDILRCYTGNTIVY